MNAAQNNPLDEEDDDINDLTTSVVNRFFALKKYTSAAL